MLLKIGFFFFFLSAFTSVNAEHHEYVQKYMAKYRSSKIFESYDKRLKPRNIDELIVYPKSQNHDVFCFIGDTGGDMGEPEQINPAGKMQVDAASLLIYHSQSNFNDRCDQTHFLGDIIYPVGIQKEDNGQREKVLFFDVYNPLLGSNKNPIYLAFGNHDYYGSVEKWFDYRNIYQNLRIPYYYYVEKIKDLCLVTIDSNPIYEQNWHNKSINNLQKLSRYYDQKKWYSQIHEKIKKECRFKVLLAHHPHKSVRDSDKNLKKFYEKFIVGQFDLIVAGHDHHLSYVGNERGTHMFISGGGGKPIRDRAKQGADEAYKSGKLKWLSFDPGFLKMKTIRGKNGALQRVEIYSVVNSRNGAKVEKRATIPVK